MSSSSSTGKFSYILDILSEHQPVENPDDDAAPPKAEPSKPPPTVLVRRDVRTPSPPTEPSGATVMSVVRASMQCNLCETLVSAADSRLVLACGHGFHYACVLPLIKSGKDYCPECPAPSQRAGYPVDAGNDADVHLVAQQLLLQRDQVRVRKQARDEPYGQVSAVTVAATSVFSALRDVSRRVLFSRGGEEAETNKTPVAPEQKVCDKDTACVFPTYCLHDFSRDTDAVAEVALWHSTNLRGRQVDDTGARVLALLNERAAPAVLRACGLTAAVLEEAGVTLEQMVTQYGYVLETILELIEPTWIDFLRIGFHPRLFVRREHFPPIVFYSAGMRAEHLLRFSVNYRYLRGELGVTLEELYVFGFRAPILCRVLGMTLIDIANALLDGNSKMTPMVFARRLGFNKRLYGKSKAGALVSRMTGDQVRMIELVREACG